jgi:hypothetical protein
MKNLDELRDALAGIAHKNLYDGKDLINLIKSDAGIYGFDPDTNWEDHCRQCVITRSRGDNNKVYWHGTPICIGTRKSYYQEWCKSGRHFCCNCDKPFDHVHHIRCLLHQGHASVVLDNCKVPGGCGIEFSARFKEDNVKPGIYCLKCAVTSAMKDYNEAHQSSVGLLRRELMQAKAFGKSFGDLR